MKLIVFSFLTIIVAFSGCSSSKTSRKPVTNIQISPANNVITYGNEFTVSVQSRINKPKVISIDLYINNELIYQSNEEEFSINIDSKKYACGKYSLKTVAKNEDGKEGINYVVVSIASNIKPEVLSYKVHEVLPHSVANYTEGFEFYQDQLLESTGNYDESFIYAYHPKSGKISRSLKLDKSYFGEGITVINNNLYQLTYKAKKGFIYDVNTFSKKGEFSFKSDEGWGLTNNGKNLIMSDGTSTISYLDTTTFNVVKTIDVSTPNGFIEQINELEYVDGIIYANIWTRQTIVKFEAETGRVLAFIDMSNIMTNFENNRIDVFNGIAYESTEKLFYVTGKWWPNTYKVSFE